MALLSVTATTLWGELLCSIYVPFGTTTLQRDTNLSFRDFTHAGQVWDPNQRVHPLLATADESLCDECKIQIHTCKVILI